jgi:hypothetical protein
VLLNRVKLDDSVLAMFLGLLDPDSRLTRQPREAIMIFLMRSCCTDSPNLSKLKEDKTLARVLARLLEPGSEYRVMALYFLLHMQRVDPLYLTRAGLLKGLLQPEQDFAEVHVVAKILGTMVALEPATFWALHENLVLPKAILLLAKFTSS